MSRVISNNKRFDKKTMSRGHGFFVVVKFRRAGACKLMWRIGRNRNFS
ncbi:hypothetical protein DCCM_0839 [Desulfocucumis palustris]|uniref:Uncharacterized protein n=1 Tax=Desulfocucumis palustris TaxID=1898651 RepID=A0A2L2XAH0_9FIRM|nr:hypothetical protein DCCM_0839 [Desulfocucumis palustris]